MTWDNFRRPIEANGVVFGTKELEFGRVESLPQHVPYQFELAVGGSSPPIERWKRLRWSVIDSHSVSETMDDYRQYIQSSRGEFSVAKNIYVATRSGWSSCRSVCYLAAGRPVIVQDTGFSEIIPTGEGLLAFSNIEQAIEAVTAVESDYEHHQKRAREIAREFFDANVVLSKMLNEIGLG
jgi:glycosyltransferase involved in cell wall biosynthesis